MYKNLKRLMLSLVMFFGFNGMVYAESIYDHLSSGDIIIGNTTFKSGTWISATRASKAGSLYTIDSGKTDVKTYKYINENVWYELDSQTDEYTILSKEKIEQLEDELKIYYNNNDGIMVTINYEDTGFEQIVDEWIKENNPSVIIDTNNKTVTCKYGMHYTSTNVNLTTSFYCNTKLESDVGGINDQNIKPMEIKEVTVPSADKLSKLFSHSASIFTNQDKIDVKYQNYTLGESRTDLISITATNKLDSKTKFIYIEIKFIDNNSVYSILAMPFNEDLSLVDTYYNYEDNSIIVMIDAFNTQGDEMWLIDEAHNKLFKVYMPITNDFNPPLTESDLEINNFGLPEFQDINQTKVSVNLDNAAGDYIININDELTEYDSEISQNITTPGKWVAFEIEIPSEFYPEYTSLLIDPEHIEKYIVDTSNNKVILWIDFASVNVSRTSIKIYNSYINNNYSNNTYINIIIEDNIK